MHNIKTNVLLLAIFIATLMIGCKVKPMHKQLKTDFTNCFEGKNTSIRSLMDIDGYYFMYDLRGYHYGFENIYVDSSSTNMIFYEDGTLLYNFFSIFDYPEDIPGYLKKVYQTGNEDPFYQGFYWGIYKIYGDTIKAQYINHTTGMAPWDAREEWFLIIDRRTIKSIYAKMLGKEMSEDEINNYREAVEKCTLGSFIPLEIIPAPNCWLKKEEWFWCKNRGGGQ